MPVRPGAEQVDNLPGGGAVEEYSAGGASWLGCPAGRVQLATLACGPVIERSALRLDHACRQGPHHPPRRGGQLDLIPDVDHGPGLAATVGASNGCRVPGQLLRFVCLVLRAAGLVQTVR
jgi:hypothetical protein